MRIQPVVVDRLRMVHRGFSVFVCVAVAFSVKLFSHDMCPCNVCAPFAVRPVEISIMVSRHISTVSFKHDVDDTILLSFVTQGLGQVTWLLQH